MQINLTRIGKDTIFKITCFDEKRETQRTTLHFLIIKLAFFRMKIRRMRINDRVI